MAKKSFTGTGTTPQAAWKDAEDRVVSWRDNQRPLKKCEQSLRRRGPDQKGKHTAVITVNFQR